MPRPRMFKQSVGSKGLSFLLAIALICYAIFSLAVAAVNWDDCRPYDRHWSFVPPKWVCEAPPGGVLVN